MSDTTPSAKGTFFVSSYLIGQAFSVYKSIPDWDDLKSNSAAALSAILLSAAASEAFINELAEFASQNRTPEVNWDGDVEYAALLGDVMAVAENSHVDLFGKFQLAHRIMADAPVDSGRAPFQDFALLIRVRNFLLHLKEPEYGYTDAQGIV